MREIIIDNDNVLINVCFLGLTIKTVETTDACPSTRVGRDTNHCRSGGFCCNDLHQCPRNIERGEDNCLNAMIGEYCCDDPEVSNHAALSPGSHCNPVYTSLKGWQMRPDMINMIHRDTQMAW